MEGGDDGGGDHPNQGMPQNQDPEVIGNLMSEVVGFVQAYGWFIVLAVAVAVYLYNRFSGNIQQWQEQREAASYKKMDGNVAQKRMEAMERARMRMQEQVNQDARIFAEKQQQKEEEKRQERLEDWDRHQQGKGYRNKTKPTEVAPNQASSTSNGNKPTQPKKRLRPEYNPLMGTEEVCRFRPSPRGGGASGGG